MHARPGRVGLTTRPREAPDSPIGGRKPALVAVLGVVETDSLRATRKCVTDEVTPPRVPWCKAVCSTDQYESAEGSAEGGLHRRFPPNQTITLTLSSPNLHTACVEFGTAPSNRITSTGAKSSNSVSFSSHMSVPDRSRNWSPKLAPQTQTRRPPAGTAHSQNGVPYDITPNRVVFAPTSISS